MTILPEMMCSPPAKRRVAATSALRTDTLSTCSRASSSLTDAVSDMADFLPLTVPPRTRPPLSGPARTFSCSVLGSPLVPGEPTHIAQDVVEGVAVGGGEPEPVVARGAVARPHLPQQHPGAQRTGGVEQVVDVADRHRVGDDDVEAQVGAVLQEGAQVVTRGH